MAVRIPIEAEANGVLKTFQQIREAISKTGQSGTAFQDLDFSHPELRELEDDIRRVQHQFEELGRVGQGKTASAVRKAIEQNSDINSWLDNASKTFPDDKALARHLSTVGKYVFNGTRYDPNPAPGSPNPANPNFPSPGGGGDGGGFNLLGGGPLGSIAKFAIGATIGGDIIKSIFGSYEDAKQEDKLNDTLYRRVDDTSVSFDQLRKKVEDFAHSMNLADNEAQGLTETWARLGRHESADQTIADTRYATSFARGYGVAPAGMVDVMARAQMAGQDPRQFALLIADAVKAGGQGGQVEETARALLRWTETAQRSLISSNSVDRFAALYAGMMRTGNPGLMGANGEAIINQINSSIQNGGGGGPGGQALMMRALMRFGGRFKDPYAVQMQLAGGAFDEIGHTGKTNLEAILAEFKREVPGANQDEQASALAQLFGLDIRQASAFLHATTTANLGNLRRAAARNNIDLTKVDAGALVDLEDAADPQFDIKGLAKKLLAQTGDGKLSKDDATALQNALDGKGGDLQSTLMRTIANHGRSMTEANLIQKAETDFSNTMQETAQSLVKPLSGLQDQAAKLLDPLKTIANYLSTKLMAEIDLQDTSGSAGLSGYLEDLGAAAFGDKDARARAQVYLEKRKERNDAGSHTLWGLQQAGTDTPQLLDVVRAQINKTADEMGFSKSWALALARTEGGGLDLTSPAGAVGAFQLMQGTADHMGVKNIHNLGDNVKGGIGYFIEMLNRFKWDSDVAVAAYNAGPEHDYIREFQRTHNLSVLPPETQREVLRFRRYAQQEDEAGGVKHTVEGHATVTVKVDGGQTQKVKVPLAPVKTAVPPPKASGAAKPPPLPVGPGYPSASTQLDDMSAIVHGMQAAASPTTHGDPYAVAHPAGGY